MAYRRKIIKILGYIIFFIIIAVFSYTIFYYEQLKINLQYEIQAYGPIGLIVAGFIVDTIGGPLGPEIPVIGGLLAGIRIPTVLYMTILGSAMASFTIYFIGYFFGEYGALNFVSKDKYERWRRFFLKNRRITLTLGALTPVPYVTLCLIAGIFKVRMAEYIFFAIGARIIRIIGAVYIVLLFQGVL